MAFLRTRTALPEIPTDNEVVSAGLTSAQIDGNFKSLDVYKAEIDQTMFIGTTSVAINRGTGALSLTDVSIDGNAGTATTLENTRTINGTSFNGSANITTSTWGEARNVTIGAAAAKSVNGSADVSWTLNEIGAAATNQTMHIGTTSVAINRVSANLSLNGIIGIYTDNATGTTNSQSITISTGSNISTSPGTPGTLTLTAGASPTVQRAGSVNIRGGSNGSGAGPALGGNVSITGGVTTSPNPIEKTSGSIYIDGGGLAANGTQTYGSVFIGNQANNTVTGTSHVTIGKTGTEVRLPGVGTSGFVKLGANGALSADTSTYALSGHTHAAADITSGVFATARLASGTANSTTFLRGDSTWATVTSGATITNDTSTNADTFYPGLTSNQTSGAWVSAVVSSTKLYYNPSKGQLNATAFNALSDVNMKENIETIVNAVDKTLLLRGVTFNWIDTKESSIGVIAQEVEDVIPDAVSTSSKGEKSVNYGVLVGVLIEAIKELKLELNQIKSSVTCQ